ncbi:tyrosine-protein phosphatase [Fibrobacterota bacterium]
MRLLAVFIMLLAVCLSTVLARVNIITPDNGTETPDTRPTDDPFTPHTDDWSIPNPTLLEWTYTEDYQEPTCDIYLSENRDMALSDLFASGISDTVFPIWNLRLDNRYYWMVALFDRGDYVRSTRTYRFDTPSLWPRMIYLDGTTNVRDIGGRENMNGNLVRQGLYYRSAELNMRHPITELGIQQIMDLGVISEIDLRRKDEGANPALPPEINYIHSQVTGIESYWYGVNYTQDQYREVFRELARAENYPLLIHCWAGADRTGTITALLEAVLNCSEEQILLNFQWTSLSIYGTRGDPNAPSFAEWNNLMAYLKEFDTDNGTLQKGVWNYLLSIGVTTEELNAIREILLEDPVAVESPNLHYVQSPRTGFNSGKILVHPLVKNRIDLSPETAHIKIYDFLGRTILNLDQNDIRKNQNISLPRNFKTPSILTFE